VWDVFGIAAILNAAAEVHAPCGCSDCNESITYKVEPGAPINSDWLVHFAVPAAHFWDDIGYT